MNEIIIQGGDTLSKLAKIHNTTVQSILHLNPDISDPNTLEIGQRIRIKKQLGSISLTFLDRNGHTPRGVEIQVKFDSSKKIERKLSENENFLSFQPNKRIDATVYAKLIGQTKFDKVISITPKDEDIHWALRIFSAKTTGKTAQHPGSASKRNSLPREVPSNKEKPNITRPQSVTPINKADTEGRPLQEVLTGPCACNRDISIAEMSGIYLAQKREILEKFLPHINSTAKKYAIDSCLRKAHFLAQVGHESGRLRYTAEVLPKNTKEADVYDGYKGRGLIQITYGTNYKKYGTATDQDFLGTNRAKLEETKWATDSAGWFWVNGAALDLNPLADKNDLLAISSYINGAFNGYEDRKMLFKLAYRALSVNQCKNTSIKADEPLAFEQSRISSSRDLSFAWGCWNDKSSKKEGVKKSDEQRKAGYSKFFEIDEKTPENKKRKRFGYSISQMHEIANKGKQ